MRYVDHKVEDDLDYDYHGDDAESFKMPIIFWQEQGDDDDVEVWGATADSGSNGFIRGGGEATEGNSWWTHGSEQVATVHKSTNTDIHFCTITLLQNTQIHRCT